MSALSQRLSDAKGDRSIDAIAERARAAGWEIDRATVGRYLQGKHAKKPPDVVLLALAAGLGLDVRELRRLAGAPAGELEPWIPPQEAARLSEDQRDVLDQLIRVMTQQRTSDQPGSLEQRHPDGRRNISGRGPRREN